MPTRSSDDQTYAPAARKFHWWTVALVFLTIPLAKVMTYRGNDLNIWDATTNALYTAHKSIGFIIFWLVLARLVYRFRYGAPADEPTLEGWQKLASHVTHWALYVLLIVVPLLGWRGVSQYGARNIVGPINLPQIAAENQDAAGFTFWLHGVAAFALVLLIGAHIGAAIFHFFIRKDGVLARMLPTVGRK